jgi:hypothetical protein
MTSGLMNSTMPAPKTAPEPHKGFAGDVTPGDRKNDRNVGLDITKGALVLFMVLYHSMNYFLKDRGGEALKYLRFLPPSFIFITGFLISNIYVAKYGVGGSRLRNRLLARGAKLFAIFTVLNILAGLLVAKNYNGRAFGIETFINNIPSTYLTGNGRAAVFEVLLPISYLLLLSGGLLAVSRCNKYLLPALLAMLVAGQILSERLGHSSANYGLFTMGVLGMILGFVPMERITSWASHGFAVIGAYALYLCAITFWTENYLVQCLGVCLTLLLIYGASSQCGGRGFVRKQFTLLGRYSLIGYIVQIGLLQVMRRALGHLGARDGQFLTALCATTALTILGLIILDYCRARWAAVNSFYLATFA